MRVLVTGRTGLIGGAFANHLKTSGIEFVAPIRPGTQYIEKFRNLPTVADIGPNTEWRQFLTKTDIVVHFAAMNQPKSQSSVFLKKLYDVNVAGTLNLALQAAENNVKRFVFISSIKVNGNSTHNRPPFKYNDKPQPTDDYAASKLEAETGLFKIAKESGMELTIVRPPLVYGPGVTGNFASLIKLVMRGFPLPLSQIKNRRSFIAIDNLIDLILICSTHPLAANKVFLASDGQDVSTPELLIKIGNAVGVPARLFPVPQQLIDFGGMMLGKKSITERLSKSLEIDINSTEKTLDWKLPISMDEALIKYFSNYSR